MFHANHFTAQHELEDRGVIVGIIKYIIGGIRDHLYYNIRRDVPKVSAQYYFDLYSCRALDKELDLLSTSPWWLPTGFTVCISDIKFEVSNCVVCSTGFWTWGKL